MANQHTTRCPKCDGCDGETMMGNIVVYFCNKHKACWPKPTIPLPDNYAGGKHPALSLLGNKGKKVIERLTVGRFA